MTAEEVIRLLELVPLEPEGGWFRETYRSDERVPASLWQGRARGERCASTTIYYLLTPDQTSLLHRLRSDEAFHFYLGDPAIMTEFHPDGTARRVTLGRDIAAGQLVQHHVRRGVWQGMRLAEGGSWALMGCTVAPGFDYADFELADRAEFLARYPDWREDVLALTP